MMHGRLNRIVAMLAGLLLATACGDVASTDYSGESLATLRGQLTASQAVDTSNGMRLALTWYRMPDFDANDPLGTEPPKFGQPNTIVTQDVVYRGSFPIQWEFSLYGPPPAEAISDFSIVGGPKRAAVGILLAYVDVNGNGKLDVIPADGHPIDQVIGSSADWTSGTGYQVIYIESDLPADNGGVGGEPLKLGFNLARADAVVPLTTPIPIELSNRPELNMFVCDPLFSSTQVVVENLCGISLEPDASQIVIGGTIELDGTEARVSLTVNQGSQPVADATMTIDGRAIPCNQYGVCELEEANTTLLAAGRTLHLRASRPGAEEATLDAQLPGEFQITAPAAGASVTSGTAVTVQWTAAAGTDDYFVELSASGGAENIGESVQTTSHTLEVPSWSGPGEARVRAYKFNTGASFVLGSVVRTQAFEFVE